MIARLIDKNQALELRKQGMTYSEIAKIVPVSKGLLSYWFRDSTFTVEEKERIASNMVGSRGAGILKSSAINRQKRLNREIVAFEDAKRIFADNMQDQRFLIGVALYWAEGAKKHSLFQFVNSDPDMVIFMHNWMQKYLKIERQRIKCRLFIHKVPGYENIELFWAGKLGLEPSLFAKTIYKPTRHLVKKKPDYKGCMRLSVANVYVFRLMRAWQKLLIQYYGNAPSW
jgi:transcriptional regulator with XRE-family HTH domain